MPVTLLSIRHTKIIYYNYPDNATNFDRKSLQKNVYVPIIQDQDYKPNIFMYLSILYQYLPILDSILCDSFVTLNVLIILIFILCKSDNLKIFQRV